MSRRPLLMLALATVAGMALFGMPLTSGATFTSTSTNTASTASSAADWNPPTVSVNDPGATVQGTATISATASDPETGIKDVTIQYLSGGTWTTICIDATAPYSCAWNTVARTDGSYSLRAIATDNAGYVTTSATVTTTVANNLSVVLADPGDILKGSVALNATLLNAGAPALYSVRIEYRLSTSTGSWTSICVDAAAPYTCTWNTVPLTQGESYDIRAVTFLSTAPALVLATSAAYADILIDNLPPTVTMTDPGTPLRGTVTLAAVAADAESDITSVVIQGLRSGTSTWTTLCTVLADPITCRYDTSQMIDGTYSFRAIATDSAQNSTTSVVVASRVIDNTVSAVSMEDPGAFLAGTVTLAASASSTAGVDSVTIQRAPAGTSTWTTVCADATAPYACSLNTTQLADGLYDFRAILVDGAAKTTISATVSNRRVDNSPLRGYDVQTANGGAVTGRLDAGDSLKLTYTQPLNLATVVAGWTGTSMPVVLRLRDANQVGLSGANDTLDVLRTAGGPQIPLGSVNLKQNYIKSGKTAQFNATMSSSSTVVNGITATTITITVGAIINGSTTPRTQANPSMVVWTPSAAVTDLNGKASSTAPTSELGVSDREF